MEACCGYITQPQPQAHVPWPTCNSYTHTHTTYVSTFRARRTPQHQPGSRRYHLLTPTLRHREQGTLPSSPVRLAESPLGTTARSASIGSSDGGFPVGTGRAWTRRGDPHRSVRTEWMLWCSSVKVLPDLSRRACVVVGGACEMCMYGFFLPCTCGGEAWLGALRAVGRLVRVVAVVVSWLRVVGLVR